MPEGEFPKSLIVYNVPIPFVMMIKEIWEEMWDESTPINPETGKSIYPIK